MTYEEANRTCGKPVRYNGEEYILLQLTKRQKYLMPGVENPFYYRAYDGLIYHPERRAAQMVPIEELEAVPKELFKRRFRFGDHLSAEAEEMTMEGTV